MKKLINHILKYREQYIFPTAGIVALWLLIHAVQHLTERAVIDDPGAVVGMAYSVMGLLLVKMVIGASKGFIIPDVDENKPDPTWKHVVLVAIDTCATVSLFAFFGWLVVSR